MVKISNRDYPKKYKNILKEVNKTKVERDPVIEGRKEIDIVDSYCDQLVKSPYRPHCFKPTDKGKSFYGIYQNFPNNRVVLLYIGYGNAKSRLHNHFNGKILSPIDMYLRSLDTKTKKSVYVKTVRHNDIIRNVIFIIYSIENGKLIVLRFYHNPTPFFKDNIAVKL
ncbi:hypothetical protein A3Q56_05089 [Intoshia linei]|uniref:Uncharacterized protein n=1 Tax=Intoshia linei TaxID=1819745 RepID=A0A177AYX7_9BILA|nr:hypothetical protein A3Q56_05089 [Intoshia linei]